MRPYLALAALFLGSFIFTLGYLGTARVSVVENTSQKTQEARLLFVGDMMFDRTIRTRIASQGIEAVLGEVAPLLAESDFVAGNLEGPVTGNASLSKDTGPGDENNTRFTFDPRVPALLGQYGVRLVSIGNNHIGDFGIAGVASTTYYLHNAGLDYVGNPFSTSTDPILETIRGIKVAFVAYNEFINPNAESARVQIKRARELSADFIVVMAHWGDEYISVAPSRSKKLAASFAESGANLIIGTHSHVIGETAHIGTTRVYYSLGNFVFDQYWDESVRCGLAVKVLLFKKSLSTTAQYVEQKVHLEKEGNTTLGCPRPS